MSGPAGAARPRSCASTRTTASRCSAPTATASRRWRSCSPGGWQPLARRRSRARRSCGSAYFAQHQIDELRPGRTRAYDHVARAAAGRARGAGARASSAASASRADKARHAGREPVGRREGAAAAGARHARRAAAADPRRADQPSRHRRREALVEALTDYPGAVILISHDRHLVELRRPALAGRRRHGAAVRRRPRRLPAPRAQRVRSGHCAAGQVGIAARSSRGAPRGSRKSARKRRPCANA